MLREARKVHGKTLKFRGVDFSLVRQWVSRNHWGNKKEKKVGLQISLKHYNGPL